MNRTISLTARQRRVLHHLLHRNLRKCSGAALESLARLGWVTGPCAGYQLTDVGWTLAELSERHYKQDGGMEIQPEMFHLAAAESDASPYAHRL